MQKLTRFNELAEEILSVFSAVMAAELHAPCGRWLLESNTDALPLVTFLEMLQERLQAWKGSERADSLNFEIIPWHRVRGAILA